MSKPALQDPNARQRDPQAPRKPFHPLVLLLGLAVLAFLIGQLSSPAGNGLISIGVPALALYWLLFYRRAKRRHYEKLHGELDLRPSVLGAFGGGLMQMVGLGRFRRQAPDARQGYLEREARRR